MVARPSDEPEAVVSLPHVLTEGLRPGALGVGRPKCPPLLLEPMRSKDKISFPSLVTSKGASRLGGGMGEEPKDEGCGVADDACW